MAKAKNPWSIDTGGPDLTGDTNARYQALAQLAQQSQAAPDSSGPEVYPATEGPVQMVPRPMSITSMDPPQAPAPLPSAVPGGPTRAYHIDVKRVPIGNGKSAWSINQVFDDGK